MDGSVVRSTFLAVAFSFAATVAVVVIITAVLLIAGSPAAGPVG